MNLRLIVILILSLSNSTLRAQQQWELGVEDFGRMGLVFATVEEAGDRSGNRFPATVVNSPSSSSVVNALLAGTVTTRHAEPGAWVSSGQPLITLYSPALLELEQEWLSGRAEQELALLAVQRDRKLFDNGIIAEQRLQQTRHALVLIETTVNAAERKLAAAGMDEPNRQALLAEAVPRGLYTIRAGSDGIVAHLVPLPGEYVDENSTVARMRKGGNLWLSIPVPARLGMKLEPGHELTLADTNERLILRQRDHETDPETQTMEILAEFEAPTTYLPGQILSVILPPIEQGIVIPAAAVVHSGHATTVYLRNARGIEARQLELVPAGNNYIAQEGIKAGEQIVVQGTAVLKGMQLGLGGE